MGVSTLWTTSRRTRRKGRIASMIEQARVVISGDEQQGTITRLQQSIKDTRNQLRRAEAEGLYLRCVVIARDLAHAYERLEAAIHGEWIDPHAQRRNSAARGW
jgi:pyrimidine operon attenuation protein/uracil phosphoribosyltransferase